MIPNEFIFSITGKSDSTDVALDIARRNMLNYRQDELHRNNGWSIDKMKLFWKFIPGTVINVPWPKEKWVVLHEMSDGSGTSALTSDPNDHYRPELEKLVGKQHIAWDWQMQATQDGVIINIKFRFDKKKLATYFALKWS